MEKFQKKRSPGPCEIWIPLFAWMVARFSLALYVTATEPGHQEDSAVEEDVRKLQYMIAGIKHNLTDVSFDTSRQQDERAQSSGFREEMYEAGANCSEAELYKEELMDTRPEVGRPPEQFIAWLTRRFRRQVTSERSGAPDSPLQSEDGEAAGLSSRLLSCWIVTMSGLGLGCLARFGLRRAGVPFRIIALERLRL